MSTARRNKTRPQSAVPAKTPAASPIEEPVPDERIALVVGAIAGALYTATAARDVVVGDSGEFLAAAATLGVAHPPGYPLLVLLGHAFSWLPLGPLAFRINLLAAVCGALTVGFVCATALRLGASRTAAVVAALALAFNPLFWEWSLAIEAFPLNNLIAAALVYCLVRWHARPDASKFLVAAAVLGGLGAANHLTIVFLVPFVAVVMWRRRTSIRVTTVLACAGAVLLGLIPYLYIPWAAARDPFINWGSISSASGLVRHFLRSDYGTGRLVAADGSPGDPFERLVALAASFTLLEGGLVLVGFMRAWRSLRWYFWGCSLSAFLAGPAFAAYANVDLGNPVALWVLRRFFLLPHVLLAPLAGFGYATAAGVIASRIHERRRQADVALASLALALIAVPAALRYSAIDQHDNHVARHFAEDVLRSAPPRSVILGNGDEIALPVSYLQAVENQRPDVTLVALGLFKGPWYVAQLRRRDTALVIPFTQYDPSSPQATLRAFVEANPGRTFELVGPLTDSSLGASHFLYRRGVVEEIEPMARDVSLEEAGRENGRLMGSYRPPDASKIRRETFEISYLEKYARAAAAMGDQYTTQHLDTQAEAWYRRALAIDPEAADVQAALAKVSSKAAR
jgi:4-amino-4-deoxy-L-arabinose transferase-like glycosyltransferase